VLRFLLPRETAQVKGKSEDFINGAACGTKEGISSVFLKYAALPAATRNGPSKG
jgi:hypothetical protein